MASPQCEDGYTKIANETMEALGKIRIPGEARQVLDIILRKTYGWKKKEDQISLSQFVEATGLSKVHICRALNRLVEMGLITKKGNAISYFTKKGNDYLVTYGFQKDFEKWRSLPKKVTLPKKVKDVTQKGNLTLPKKVPTKEIIKKTITKENPPIIPPWINPKTWIDFLEHRKQLKPTFTLRAQELTIKKLERLKEQGNNPDEVLNQSIMNGWKGIFEIKEGANEQRIAIGKRASTGKTQEGAHYSDGRPYPVDFEAYPDSNQPKSEKSESGNSL